MANYAHSDRVARFRSKMASCMSDDELAEIEVLGEAAQRHIESNFDALIESAFGLRVFSSQLRYDEWGDYTGAVEPELPSDLLRSMIERWGARAPIYMRYDTFNKTTGFLMIRLDRARCHTSIPMLWVEGADDVVIFSLEGPFAAGLDHDGCLFELKPRD